MLIKYILVPLIIFVSPLHGMFDDDLDIPYMYHPLLKEEQARRKLQAYNDLYNLVKARIDNKADLNQPVPTSFSFLDNTPLHMACLQGDHYLPITQLLLDNGAETHVFNQENELPLCCAARALAVKTVTLLPKTKDDVNNLDGLKWSMIYSISAMDDQIYDKQKAINRVKIARLLLAHGAHPNFQNSYMTTCLHRLIAHSYSFFDTTDWFSNKSIEQRELFFNQRKTLIRTLLEYGASLNLAKDNGHNPIQLAYAQTDHHPKNQEIYRELAQYALNHSARLRRRLASIIGHSGSPARHQTPFRILPKDVVNIIVNFIYPPYTGPIPQSATP